MTIESATRRVVEIQSMIEPQPASAQAGAYARTSDVSRAVFAEQLARAQGQIIADSGDAGTDSSGPGSADVSLLSSLAPTTGQGLPVSASPYGASAYGVNPYGAATAYPGTISQYMPTGGYAPTGAAPMQGTQGVYPMQSAQGIYGMPYSYPGRAGQFMVSLAQREIGVTESPPGSNDSPRIAQYRSATAGANTPGPWCAYFVSWLAQQSGAPIGQNGSGIGYVPALEQWGKQTGRAFSGSMPQPGDIAIFERNGDSTPDHTGIVEYVDPSGTIHTIEGNSSNCVQRQQYSLAQIKSFVRPG